MSLTPETIANIERYIDKAKLETPGSVTREESQELFKTARMDTNQGNKMWQMIDKDNKGKLDRIHFVVLLFLISQHKKGTTYDSLPSECVQFIENSKRKQEAELKAKHDFEHSLNSLRVIVDRIEQSIEFDKRNEETQIIALEQEVR